MCPPAQLQILQQEFHTQKQVWTIQLVQVFLLYLWSVFALRGAHVLPLTAICYFRLCVSAGRNSWYFSGFEQWGETEVVNFVSPGSGSNGNTGYSQSCLSGARLANGVNDPVTICLLSVHLCEDDLPAVSESGFPPKSGPDPIHYPDHMWAILVNHRYLVYNTCCTS